MQRIRESVMVRPGQAKGGEAMRRARFAVLPAVLAIIAAACGGGGKAGTPSAGGGSGTNKGTVNVLNALEPEENAVLQSISDKLINPKVDYKVEFEQSADFEEQTQIRAEGGTLDVI